MQLFIMSQMLSAVVKLSLFVLSVDFSTVTCLEVDFVDFHFYAVDFA